jgi:nicotinamide phosphoribosyltransferase
MGSDNVPAIREARQLYGAEIAGFSIPAMEHSTVTSWTRAGEVAAYRNMLKLYGKPSAMLAAVSDSYNIYEACKMWGTELKDEVIASGATVVIRPDSGLPSEVVLNCVRILDKYFGSTINAKGYKVLNNVRVIQGDGIDHASIRSILFCLDMNQYSADNVAFGQGGALLQQVNRDTMKFAMKCSSIAIRNTETGKLEYRDVYKDPITDSGKTSKKGRVTLFKNQDGTYYSGVEDWMEPVLKTVFLNGEILVRQTLDEIRANVLATE